MKIKKIAYNIDFDINLYYINLYILQEFKDL